jgi:hypothetical protein
MQREVSFGAPRCDFPDSFAGSGFLTGIHVILQYCNVCFPRSFPVHGQISGFSWVTANELQTKLAP